MKTWRWQARVLGDLAELAALGESFGASPTRIFSTGWPDEYLMESDAFAELTEAAEVHAQSRELLQILSGFLRFEQRNAGELSVSAIYKKHDDGRQDAYVFPRGVEARAEICPGAAYVTDKDGNRVTATPFRRPILRAVDLAISDQVMAKVMRLMGQGATNWVAMYRIYEVIEEALGGQHAMERLDWINKDELRQFKHSANSVSAAGDLARHGSEPHAPPKNPMTIVEAQSFFRRTLEDWIDRRLQ